MTLGIRGKLLGLLVAVALLPLTAAVVIITLSWAHLRSQTFGESILSLVVSEQRAIDVSLAKDIEKLLALFSQDAVASRLAGMDRAMSPEELARLDEAWPTTSEASGAMAEVLRHPISEVLKRLRADEPAIAEVFVTDRFGQLVAASGRTEDFYQADEDWWQQAYAEGRGKVYLPPLGYDRSSRTWSVDLCIPIARQGKVVGVAKAVLDVTRLFAAAVWKFGTMDASLRFVRRDGTVLYSPGFEPMKSQLPDWQGAIAHGKSAGWRVSGGEIQAYSPVLLPERIGGYPVSVPDWSIVLSVSKSQALRPTYQFAMLTLAGGLAMTAVIFVAGLYLVERGIVRRVRRLSLAAAAVQQGDLTARIEPGWGGRRLLGGDELDDLATDFNCMMDRVQKSHDDLQAANALKENFIRVAGHELRTPVGYILGMARLLRDCNDLRRFSEGVSLMGARARRLEEVIESIFKLLPTRQFGSDLRYSDVNVAGLLEEIYQDCRPFVEKRGQEVRITGAENAPVLRADRRKVRDIVENLVMNAIKFTPDGGTIRIAVRRQLGGFLGISVQDEGPGIPPADVPHIFQPFFSGADVMKHSSGTSEFGKKGIGLGLAIAKSFALMHGGDVTFTTGPEGSRFVVSLPIRGREQAQAEGSSFVI